MFPILCMKNLMPAVWMVLSVAEAHDICQGHFHTSPLGLVDKIPSIFNGVFHPIRHLSKPDHLGISTNSWLDASHFPTHYHLATHCADMVRLFSILSIPFFFHLLISNTSHVLCFSLPPHNPSHHSIQSHHLPPRWPYALRVLQSHVLTWTKLTVIFQSLPLTNYTSPSRELIPSK